MPLRKILLILLYCMPALPALAQNATAPDVSKEPARTSPQWLHDGVIYQIFPRDFSTAGNFAGITAQLDRLQQLGVTILWLMPIHPIGEAQRKGTLGSPYAVRDYYGISRELGTEADLHRLIAAAHDHGMKVIIDLVANHTAWDSVLMKHPEYYTHDASGKIIPPVPDWADVADLNYDNVNLRRYMSDMLVHWIRDFDLDGFRCDVAGYVPRSFWEEAREQLDRTKPGIMMLAEAEEPALLVKAFDIDYGWALHSTLTDVIQGRKPASALRDTWQQGARSYPVGALRMRFSDDHDERRAIARFGEPAALAASALMFTLDGVPLIYNGMEVGDTGESGTPALFEKIPILWSIATMRPEFPAFYQQIVAFRKAHAVLRDGAVQWVHNSDENRVLSFLRRDAGETLLVTVNLSNQPFIGLVEAGSGEWTEITPAAGTTKATGAAVAALPAVALSAWQYRVFRHN